MDKIENNLRCEIYNQKYEISGYFVRFNHRSKIIKEELDGIVYNFTETFLKGSLDDALQKIENNENPIAFKVNHTETFEGDLTISQDDKGGRFKIILPRTTENKKLYKQVESGELAQTSFQFGITKSMYVMEIDPAFRDEPNNQLYSRTIHNIHSLSDVSCVSNPAYYGMNAQSSMACTNEQGERGFKTTRLTNFHAETKRGSIIERAIKVRDMADASTTTIQKLKTMDLKNEIKNIFNIFTGIPGFGNPSEARIINEQAIRSLSTINVDLTNDIVAQLQMPKIVYLQGQLERMGIKFFEDGNVLSAQSADSTVSILDEGETFVDSDFESLLTTDLQKYRIGTTYKITNELLASSTFVNSLVQGANDEIMKAILAELINNNVADFTQLSDTGFDAAFVENAMVTLGDANGSFITNITEIIPQLFAPHGSKNVVNRSDRTNYFTETENQIIYDLGKYLNTPTQSIYGDFRFAFINLISGLQVMQNPYGATNIKQGQTDVTIFREFSAGITDPSKFVKST